MRMTLPRIACGAGVFAVSAVFAAGAAGAGGATRHALDVSDFDRLLSVESVACSSDGTWIAYTVEGSDSESDDRKSAVWMTDFQGTAQLRLTAAGEATSAAPPRTPWGRRAITSWGGTAKTCWQRAHWTVVTLDAGSRRYTALHRSQRKNNASPHPFRVGALYCADSRWQRGSVN